MGTGYVTAKINVPDCTRLLVWAVPGTALEFDACRGMVHCSFFILSILEKSPPNLLSNYCTIS